MIYETFIRVINGKQTIEKMDKFRNVVKNLTDGLWLIRLEKVQSTRSQPQNAYYFGVVVRAYVQGVRDAWGEEITSDEAHVSLKEKFNSEVKTDEEHGFSIIIIKDTHNLDGDKFWEYVTRCRDFIQEFFNIETPDPV